MTIPMTSAVDIIGYAADAEVLCVTCASARYPDLHGTDREGNPITPFFAMWAIAGMGCAACGDLLDA